MSQLLRQYPDGSIWVVGTGPPGMVWVGDVKPEFIEEVRRRFFKRPGVQVVKLRKTGMEAEG